MQGTKPIDADIYAETGIKGGAVNIPTNKHQAVDCTPTTVSIWANTDKFEFKGDGILYGKQTEAKTLSPFTNLQS